VRYLVAAAIILTALGVWFRLEAAGLYDDPAVGNQALVDPAATSKVVEDVDAALGKVFSYRYDNTAATEQAAEQTLAGNARGQYNDLFAQVKQQAPAQKLLLTTKVVDSGVTMLQGEHAQLLVFLDQSATRGDTNRSSLAAAELTVTAQRQGDHWVITDLRTR
jgi:Mce-associated membrane protein